MPPPPLPQIAPPGPPPSNPPSRPPPPHRPSLNPPPHRPSLNPPPQGAFSPLLLGGGSRLKARGRPTRGAPPPFPKCNTECIKGRGPEHEYACPEHA